MLAQGGGSETKDDLRFGDAPIAEFGGNAGVGIVSVNPDLVVDDFEVEGGRVEVARARPAAVDEATALVAIVEEGLGAVGAIGAVAVVGVFLEEGFDELAQVWLGIHHAEVTLVLLRSAFHACDSCLNFCQDIGHFFEVASEQVLGKFFEQGFGVHVIAQQ